MKLSYGQIYITLQCGPTSECTELNVISFKVKTHCAFTSRPLIPGVLELAKGSDVICESGLRSEKLILRHRSDLDQCDETSYSSCGGNQRAHADARGVPGQPLLNVTNKRYERGYLQVKACKAASGSTFLVNLLFWFID